MKKLARLVLVIGFAAALSACGNGADEAPAASRPAGEADVAVSAPEVGLTPDDTTPTATAKPGAPVKIDYRIIGQPIVGQPVAIDLRFDSTLDAETFDVSYRVNDATALQFPETQLTKTTVAPSMDASKTRRSAAQQVSVIPLREGRLYLNVAVSVASDAGSLSTVTAVPIQVGAAQRELVENGTVTTDENGDLIRTLPAKED